MLKSLPGAFKGGGKHKDADEDWDREKKEFYQKIGQLEMERDWLKKKSEQLGILPGSKTRHDR